MGSLKEKVTMRVEEEFRSPELEAQLLGYLLRKSAVLAMVVQPDWFCEIAYRKAVQLIRELRVVMSLESVMHELKRRKWVPKADYDLYEDALQEAYLAELDGVNDKAARLLIAQLVRLHETRSLLTLMADVLSNMKDFDLDSTKRKLFNLSRKVMIEDESREGDYVADYHSRLEIIANRQEDRGEEEGGSVGVPTGIGPFDRRTGGLLPEEFGVIAGQPGVGKTAALLQFGAHAWKAGYNVLFCNGEMAKPDIQFRLDANFAEIDATKFRMAELDEDDLKRWDTEIKKLSAVHENYFYTVSFPRAFTVADVEAVMLRLGETKGNLPDLLLLDYLNIMGSLNSKSGQKEWSAQADIVWEVKGLVAEYGMRCWSANQVVDDAFSKETYNLSDLKYSRAIGETAPIVVALIQTEKDKVLKRIKLQFLKMRGAEPPEKPIALSPAMQFMRIHQDISVVKSLSDLRSNIIDEADEVERKGGKRRSLA